MHQSTEPQRLGFWDQKPSLLRSLSSLSGEVEAELVSARGQRSSVAIVQGHSGSGAVSVALDACNKLLATGHWTQAAYVCIKASHGGLGFLFEKAVLQAWMKVSQHEQFVLD